MIRIKLIKKFLALLFPLILISFTLNAFADFENKDFMAKSENGEVFLSLQFGENQYSTFDRPIPFLKSGSLVLGDRIIEINNASVKIMGDSFVVHSDKILIYAKGTNFGEYLINCYVIGGHKLEPIKLISFQQEIQKEIEENHANIELIVLVQQDIRTFWNDTYDLAVKVFDKSINPKPQFYQSLGAIDQAKVSMVIKNSEGLEIKRFVGETNSKGFLELSYFVPQNIIPRGSYNVELSVDYKGVKNFQSFETFIVGDTRASDSSN